MFVFNHADKCPERDGHVIVVDGRLRFRRLAIAVLFVLLAGLARLLTVTPAVVGFTITVLVASAWCYWLDGHSGGSPKS